MQSEIDTRIPSEVEREVSSIFLCLFPNGDSRFIPKAFAWIQGCFSGAYKDFQAIDARYHDLEHTLQGTLCLARLLHGRHQAHASPSVTIKMFELAMVAILFHDTGYLKKKSDAAGTGAKYTATHVMRSLEFAREFLAEKGYTTEQILSVQNMIRCTGLQADLKAIPFQSELERTLGFALATADLLGQMSAGDYVEKLPVLYQEFAEAIEFDPKRAWRFAMYTSTEDLMRRTPEFWQTYVLPRISQDFGKLYTYLNEPYPDGSNPYVIRIEKNIARLQRELSNKTS